MRKLNRILLLSFMLLLIFGSYKSNTLCTDDDLILKKGKVITKGLDQDRYVVMKNYDNLKVHYRIIGKGPIDIVFIPGWTNPLTVYTKQFDYFRDKARCIYIDLPGTGLSDAPTPNTPKNPIVDGSEYTMELMADAVYTIIKKEGIHKFMGVGFSMGPKVLGMYERLHPGMIQKLVVIDGGFNPWPTEEPDRQNFIKKRDAKYMGQLSLSEDTKKQITESLVSSTTLPQDLIEFVTYFHKFPSDILANTSYHASAENANKPVGWMYPKLCFFSKPIEEINMEKVNLIYPNNKVYGFPGGGHVIHWVFHKEINPLIWDFVKDRPDKK